MRAESIEELLAGAPSGERRVVGRLISIVERDGDGAEEIAEWAHARSGRAHIVGITGAPGAGKSTLVGGLLAVWAKAGRRPAVLAVDPTSPLTGGAILGDRVRMDSVATGAFVRSMATRGHRGGLALAVPGAVRVLDAAGFDPVVVETTGVGQVEVDIVGAADTTVLVVAAGWGDAVQASKAGLLEVADLFVVNKADRHGAHDARRDLDLMLDLGRVSGHEDRRGHRPEIVMTTSTTGHGVEGVANAIDEHLRHLVESGERARAYHRRVALEVRDRAQALLVTRVAKLLSSEDGRVALDAAERRAMTPAAAARAVAARIIAAPDRTSPEHDRS